MEPSGPSVWMLTGSPTSTKPSSSSNPGEGNTMRAVFTDLSGRGRQASSPARSRLAAIWLKPKPADD